MNKLSDDFTQGSIAKKLLKFMIPILGALVLQAMYSAVDLLVVGQFGTSAGISAVSTGSNIINLATFIITGLTMGVTVLISRYLGEQSPERIGKVIGGAIAFFFLLTVMMMALLLVFAPGFARALNAPEEVELAETLLEIHPWADMVRYARTGGEALSVAVFPGGWKSPAAVDFRFHCLCSKYCWGSAVCGSVPDGRGRSCLCYDFGAACQRSAFTGDYKEAGDAFLSVLGGHRL